jgi:predicted ester cyclase
MERTAVEAFYRRYIDRCNAHQFAGLGEFVNDDVRVNDDDVGLDGYIAGLEAVGRAFPDFRWELRHLLVDASWIAAHFTDTGRAVRIREFALYRLADGKIAEVWGDLPEVDRLAQ